MMMMDLHETVMKAVDHSSHRVSHWQPTKTPALTPLTHKHTIPVYYCHRYQNQLWWLCDCSRRASMMEQTTSHPIHCSFRTQLKAHFFW